jgi:hypothetical protein
MTLQALDLDRPVPAGAHELSQAKRVIIVGLVRLQSQRRRCLQGVEADHGDAGGPETVRRQNE